MMRNFIRAKASNKKPGAVARRHPGQQRYAPSAARNYSSPSSRKQSRRKPDLPSPAAFYSAVIEAFTERDNNWAWGSCPFHADTNPSFCMSLQSGYYRCMSSNCEVSGNNIVSFVGALHGLSRYEAIRYLEGCV